MYVIHLIILLNIILGVMVDNKRFALYCIVLYWSVIFYGYSYNNITEILYKVALNTITLTPSYTELSVLTLLCLFLGTPRMFLIITREKRFHLRLVENQRIYYPLIQNMNPAKN